MSCAVPRYRDWSVDMAPAMEGHGETFTTCFRDGAAGSADYGCCDEASALTRELQEAVSRSQR